MCIRDRAEFMLSCFSILEGQQDDVVRALANNNEFFTKRDVMDLLDIKSAQAGVLLKRLIDKGELTRVSRGKTTRYVKYREHLNLSPYSQKEKVLKLINDKKIVTNREAVSYTHLDVYKRQVKRPRR